MMNPAAAASSRPYCASGIAAAAVISASTTPMPSTIRRDPRNRLEASARRSSFSSGAISRTTTTSCPIKAIAARKVAVVKAIW